MSVPILYVRYNNCFREGRDIPVMGNNSFLILNITESEQIILEFLFCFVYVHTSIYRNIVREQYNDTKTYKLIITVVGN